MGQVISKIMGKVWQALFRSLQAPAAIADDKQKKPSMSPIAVNFHFSRKCNYECGFCFHTATTSYKLPLQDAKALIKLLAEAGCKKLNFAGGEPFLPDHTGKDNYLGEMVKYAKECGFESVSIISNSYYVSEDWIKRHAQYLDILGVSCDSADDITNAKIGRGKKGNHTQHIKRAAKLCHQYNIMFKLNTVVNTFNQAEDMSALVNEIHPMRWKIFQVLGVKGENNGRGAKRDVAEFLIPTEQFNAFVERHRQAIATPEIMKIEDNSTMQSSYVLIDERGCFLDCSTGGKIPTRPILEVGVQAAWKELTSSAGGGFDQQAFVRRDGLFAWRNERLYVARSNSSGCGGGGGGGGGGDLVDMEDLAGN